MAEKAKVQVLLPADEWEKRQIETLSRVGKKNYETGIAAPDANPIEAGSSEQAEKRYANAMRKVLDKEARKKGVERSSIDEWFTYSKEFSDKLVGGVKGRRAKVSDFIEKYHPLLKDAKSDVRAMPKATASERNERMLAMVEKLREMGGKF